MIKINVLCFEDIDLYIFVLKISYSDVIKVLVDELFYVSVSMGEWILFNF